MVLSYLKLFFIFSGSEFLGPSLEQKALFGQTFRNDHYWPSTKWPKSNMVSFVYVLMLFILSLFYSVKFKFMFLSVSSWENLPFEKIDFLRSTFNVDFMKDRIKISEFLDTVWGSKIVCDPFSQFLAKSNDPNTNFRAFFLIYTNQITKLYSILIIFIKDESFPLANLI